MEQINLSLNSFLHLRRDEFGAAHEDPHQFRNLWEDPGYRSVRSDLVSDLYDSLPAGREPKLPVSRPA